MKCSICGTPSVVDRREEGEYAVVVHRRCDNGHRFTTKEVHPTMLADKRELDCAQRNIARRVAHWLRDKSIAADSRPNTVVAAEHGITEARVRQIRAAHAPQRPRWPTFQFNSERTDQ